MDIKTRQLILAAPLLVCDFDGTLASLQVRWDDLRRDLHQLVNSIVGPLSITGGVSDYYRQLSTHGSPTEIETALNLVARYEVEGFSPENVNVELVQLLRERTGPNVIFSSNSRRAIEKILVAPVWQGICPLIVGKEDVAQEKPHPEGLQIVLAHFVVDPSNAVFVGNSEIDRKAGINAGVPTIIV